MRGDLSSRGGALAAAGRGQAGFTPRRPTNPLLQRDDVGRAKTSCYDLPDTAFTYGRPGNQDLEGAREVSMRWASHKPSRAPEDLAPDFQHLHKKAAAAKIVNSKDLKHFRKEYDLTETPRGHMGMGQVEPVRVAGTAGSKPLVPSDVIPGFTYGRKVRPSTPIHEVISYRFGEQAEQESQRAGERAAEQRSLQMGEVRRIHLTNASRGHATNARKAAMQLDSTEKDTFKLTKFSRATPKVDSNLRKTPHLEEHAGSLVDVPAFAEESVPGPYSWM